MEDSKSSPHYYLSYKSYPVNPPFLTVTHIVITLYNLLVYNFDSTWYDLFHLYLYPSPSDIAFLLPRRCKENKND